MSFKTISQNFHRIPAILCLLIVLILPVRAMSQSLGTLEHDHVQVENVLWSMKYPANVHQCRSIDTRLSMGRGNLHETEEVNIDYRTKSKGKAFLYSFILPGAGEYYLGRKSLAKTFFITEVFLWASYFSFETYSDWLREDMYTMAATHANANIHGRPAQYFVDIGNFNDIYLYNDTKERQREYYKIYDIEDYYWSWQSEEYREKFEDLRISSDRAHNRAVFVVGAIIANHVVSAIDAVWQSSRLEKRMRQQDVNSLNLHFSSPPNEKFRMTVVKHF
ncbi:hypothetical protein JXB12_09425 [candidate division KSB1 bacterium]|nr:hypothetical protein [candidate division KSB1 bacterium]